MKLIYDERTQKLGGGNDWKGDVGTFCSDDLGR